MSNQTTIILGAGASVDYGYPTGEQLINNITYKANNTDKFVSSFVKNREELRQADEFCKGLAKYDPQSIDRYLSMHSENKQLVHIGKVLITSDIISKSDPSKFTRSNDNNWYKYLFDYVFENNDFEIKLDNDEFRIITFNYDLSLEYFFHSRLEQIPILDDKKQWDVFCKFCKKIHHVYGQIYDYTSVHETGFAKLSCDGTSSLDRFMFVNNEINNYRSHIPITETGLKIIGEERDLKNSPEMTYLRSFLNTSNRIFILGFGFDSVNCDLIGLNLESLKNSRKSLYVTNYNNVSIINQKISSLDRQHPYKKAHNHMISTSGVYESLRDEFLL